MYQVLISGTAHMPETSFADTECICWARKEGNKASNSASCCMLAERVEDLVFALWTFLKSKLFQLLVKIITSYLCWWHLYQKTYHPWCENCSHLLPRIGHKHILFHCYKPVAKSELRIKSLNSSIPIIKLQYMYSETALTLTTCKVLQNIFNIEQFLNYILDINILNISLYIIYKYM